MADTEKTLETRVDWYVKEPVSKIDFDGKSGFSVCKHV